MQQVSALHTHSEKRNDTGTNNKLVRLQNNNIQDKHCCTAFLSSHSPLHKRSHAHTYSHASARVQIHTKLFLQLIQF